MKRLKAWILRWLGAVPVEDLEAYYRAHNVAHETIGKRLEELPTNEQILQHYTSHNAKLVALNEYVDRELAGIMSEVNDLRNKVGDRGMGSEKPGKQRVVHQNFRDFKTAVEPKRRIKLEA